VTAPTLEGTPGKPVASSLRWIALGAVSLGVAATILNQTISNVAIPAISKEIGLTTENATWVNAAYALTFASLLLLMGRLADLVGRRKIFITGLLIFSASSIVVALTQPVGQLVAARIAQVLGAAMILPASLSLVNAVFKGRDRAIAFAVWGSTIGIVSAIGPLLGGWIIGVSSWQWAFLINAPIGILTLILALKFIPDSKDADARDGLDVLGAILATSALALITFGIIEGQAYGWVKTLNQLSVGGLTWTYSAISPTAAALFLGITLIISFLLWEKYRAAVDKPVLFDLSLYSVRSFRYGTLVGLLVSLGEFGVLFALSLFLQSVYGYTALQAGAVLATLAFGAFAGTAAAVRASRALGPAVALRIGMVLEVVGILWLGWELTPNGSGWSLVAPLVVYGAGVGFATSQLAGISLSQVPPAKSGQASGAQSTSRALGAAIGTAVLGATLLAGFGSTTAALTDRGVTPAVAQQVTAGLRASAGISFTTLSSKPNGEVLVAGAAQGYSTAVRGAAFVAAGFITIGLGASFLLPNVSLNGRKPEEAAKIEESVDQEPSVEPTPEPSLEVSDPDDDLIKV